MSTDDPKLALYCDLVRTARLRRALIRAHAELTSLGEEERAGNVQTLILDMDQGNLPEDLLDRLAKDCAHALRAHHCDETADGLITALEAIYPPSDEDMQRQEQAEIDAALAANRDRLERARKPLFGVNFVGLGPSGMAKVCSIIDTLSDLIEELTPRS